jgi:DNA-binding CsgD family transcriptional regulator
MNSFQGSHPATKLMTRGLGSTVTSPAPDLATLSMTERRVMEAVASGMARGEAALSLRLSIHTVGHALTSAKEKLYARTLTEAAAIYVRLTTPPANGRHVGNP